MDWEKNILKIYSICFLQYMFFMAPIMIPFFMNWGGLSYTQIFMLQAWFVVVLFAMEVPTGAIADKFGRKFSISSGFILASLASLTYASYPHFWVFFLAETLWGTGISMISGADEALMYDTLKAMKKSSRSKEYFKRATMVTSLAIIVAAPIGGYMASIWGLRAPVLFTAVPMGVGALAALTITEAPFKGKKREKYTDLIKKSFGHFRGHKVLQALIVDLILVGTCAHMMYWLYQPLLIEHGFKIVYFGLVAAAMNIVGIFVLAKIHVLEKQIGVRKVILWSGLIPGLLMIYAGIAENAYLMVAAISVMFGIAMARDPIFAHYIHQMVPSAQRATIISIISMIWTLVAAVMYLIVGPVLDWSVSYAVMGVGAAMVVFSLTSRVSEEMLEGNFK